MIIVTPGFIRLSCVSYKRFVEIPVVLSDTNKYDGQATDFPCSGAVAQAAERGGRCGKGIASTPDTNPRTTDQRSLISPRAPPSTGIMGSSECYWNGTTSIPA